MPGKILIIDDVKSKSLNGVGNNQGIDFVLVRKFRKSTYVSDVSHARLLEPGNSNDFSVEAGSWNI